MTLQFEGHAFNCENKKTCRAIQTNSNQLAAHSSVDHVPVVNLTGCPITVTVTRRACAGGCCLANTGLGQAGAVRSVTVNVTHRARACGSGLANTGLVPTWAEQMESASSHLPR